MATQKANEPHNPQTLIAVNPWKFFQTLPPLLVPSFFTPLFFPTPAGFNLACRRLVGAAATITEAKVYRTRVNREYFLPTPMNIQTRLTPECFGLIFFLSFFLEVTIVSLPIIRTSGSNLIKFSQ